MNATSVERIKLGTFIKQLRVSPRRFARIYDIQKGNIERIRIVPPRLGTRDFGALEVSFRVPVNDPELCQTK